MEQYEDSCTEPRGAYFGEVTKDKRDERHLQVSIGAWGGHSVSVDRVRHEDQSQ